MNDPQNITRAGLFKILEADTIEEAHRIALSSLQDSIMLEVHEMRKNLSNALQYRNHLNKKYPNLLNKKKPTSI